MISDTIFEMTISLRRGDESISNILKETISEIEEYLILFPEKDEVYSGDLRVRIRRFVDYLKSWEGDIPSLISEATKIKDELDKCP